MTAAADDVFATHRGTLFGIAYRLLGTRTDAEDVLQDAWLRWSAVTRPVERPRAYLARTVTNLALDRLKSAAATREAYVGPWLPEPLVTAPDAAEEAETAESVSLALLVLLETLSPLERAVFVLHEVFGFSFGEVAGIVDRSEVAVRQIGSRARAHVQARRPRFEPSRRVREQVTERFVAACLGGDLNAMLELLAPDVAAWTDGGGKVRAARRPLHGADAVARWILGVLATAEPGMAVAPVAVNGQPGLLVTVSGVPDSVASYDVLDGRIAAIRLIRNPDKLRGVHLA